MITSPAYKTVKSFEFEEAYVLERIAEVKKFNLEDAINAQPEPPCTDCNKFDLCATQKLACKAFFGYTMQPSSKEIYADWVKMGRKPDAKIFAKTFRQEDL